MRRPLDQYYTNEYLTRTLLKHVNIYGSILEPCAGKGHISSILKELPNAQVIENDIDPSMGFAYVDDATIMRAKIWGRQYDWVVTNPPFNKAFSILEKSWVFTTVGVAMLLRLSFLEPTIKRSTWLSRHASQLSNLIIFGTPRPSFTDDGYTDTVTAAWFVWQHGYFGKTQVDFETRKKTVL